jgi:hypothetical protein
LLHSNRWRGDPKGFGNAMKGLLIDWFMRKRNRSHRYLEADKIEAIMGIITSGMGKNSHRKITF